MSKLNLLLLNRSTNFGYNLMRVWMGRGRPFILVVVFIATITVDSEQFVSIRYDLNLSFLGSSDFKLPPKKCLLLFVSNSSQ